MPADALTARRPPRASMPGHRRCEVVPERHLDAGIVSIRAVLVFALTPERLRADREMLIGCVEHIGRGILAELECVVVLQLRVVDLGAAVADRARPMLSPRMVVVEH